MPPPPHLLPILDRLGDGATVHLAQTVDTLIREALAAHIPPEAADILRDRDHYHGQLTSLTAALIEGWPEAVTREDAEHDPVGTAVTLLRAQRSDLAWLRPHVPALEAEVTRLRGELAERPAPILLTDPGASLLDVAESRDETLVHDLDGVGVVEDTDHDPDDDLDWQVLEATEVAAEIPSTALPLPAPAPPSAVADAPNEIVRAWCAEQVPPVPCNAKGPVQRRARDAYTRAHLTAATAVAAGEGA